MNDVSRLSTSGRTWLSLFLLACWGCGDDRTVELEDATPRIAESEPATKIEVAEQAAPAVRRDAGLCRVYSAEPGLLVFVDGQPARDEAGQFLRTPCEIAVARGSRNITVSLPEFQDASRVVNVSDLAEVEFPALKPAAELSIVSASAPLLELPAGQPFPLAAVNSSGAELDPFLSLDGLTLWFAGERRGGRAIYFAYRPSPWHDFGEPEALLLTRGPSVPAAPTLAADGLTIFYAVPDDSRLWQMTRTDPLAPFEKRETILFSTHEDAVWPSTQILPDALRAYWVERRGDRSAGYAAVRKSRDQNFSAPIEYPLPGLIPCLSADGLRQYTYDGSTLSRASRASLSEKFSDPKPLRELMIPGYATGSLRRQFHVTEDEQWMIYCLDPASAPDLYLVHLSETPGRGAVPLGKVIPPKPQATVADAAPMTPAENPAEATPPAAELSPLPFSVYAREWNRLVGERKYNEAAQLTRRGLDDPALASSAAVLRGDLVVLQDLQRFRKLASDAFSRMSPGTAFTIGTVRVEWLRFEDEILHFRLGMQEKQQPFFDIPAASLVVTVESFADKTDENVRAAIGFFQLFDPGTNLAAALKRLEGNAELQRRVVDAVADRRLHEATLEFERGNFPAGFDIVRDVREQFPGSAAEARTREIERGLYSAVAWTNVGNRQWQTDPAEGEFVATPGRVEGAYLKSPRSMRNFDLQFEWKTTGPVGQGGVYFHYPGEGLVFNRAYKIHLGNDFGVAPDNFCTGSLFGREAPEMNAVKPQSEWNTARLVVRGTRARFDLNGKTVLDTLVLDDQIPEEGFVLLDGVTGGIAYRHVLLMEVLSPTAAATPPAAP